MAKLQPRQEKYAQNIAKGMSQHEAYLKAGYDCSPEYARTAASRLSTNVNVKKRIEELTAKAAEKAELTTAHFAKRLERLAAAAERQAVQTDEDTGEEVITSKDASDIARMCSMDAAKLLGLIIDRSQIESENVNFIMSDEPLTDEEWEQKFGDPNSVEATTRPPTRAH